ncbi:MAG TPA: GNAT family N-acetyltransferase [Polyangiaceae bacterium]|nr:GNAT family N-acetyltransferase [Polyangiaceae bacterium]
METPDESTPIRIRPAVEADAEGIVRVHFEAVHTTAAGFYTHAVIESWSREPDERRFARFRSIIAEGRDPVIVADQGGCVVGFGIVASSDGEVRAVYVHPRVGRRGVGGLIVAELERLATVRGLTSLHLKASVNAEGFYVRHGYQIVERGAHRLPDGNEMSCVRMTKSLIAKRIGPSSR